MEMASQAVPTTDVESLQRLRSGSVGKKMTLNKDEIGLLTDPKLPIEEVLARLEVTEELGLSSAEAAARYLTYGENAITKEEKMPLWMLFLSQFLNFVILILLAAAIVSIVVGEHAEGGAVIAIVFITVAIATGSEYSSSNALEALAELSNPHAHVYRDGRLDVISTPHLVPGDIVELSPGDLIPADIRIIDAHSVKVNEMILTGEAADVNKKATMSNAETSKLTQVNMVYSSTSMVEGRLRGVVLHTGMNTRVGSIAALLNSTEPVQVDHKHAAPDTKEQQLGRQRSLSDLDDPNELETSEDIEADGGDDQSSDGGEHEDDNLIAEVSVNTSEPTLYSQIWNRMRNYKPKRTPLQEEIDRLGYFLTSLALSASVLVAIIGIFRNFRDPNNDDNAAWLQSLMLAVSMAVSAIPEGLPFVMVICLALGTNALSKKNALIRRLPAVETLGSASVICSDKTGTLTSGKMTAIHIWTNNSTFSISGQGYNPTHGHISDSEGNKKTMHRCDSDVLSATMQIAALCNDALIRCEDAKWKPIGTSTEAALVAASTKFGIDCVEFRNSHERVLTIPFSSKFKLMSTANRMSKAQLEQFPTANGEKGSESDILVLAKGAPHQILERCTHCYMDKRGAENTIEALTPEMRQLILEECDKPSERGLRVLAMCYKRVRELPSKIANDIDGELSSEERISTVITEMVFCGLVGMMDPPRAGVRNAVLRAKKGGVRTVMITGDYLKTAVAIGEMVCILEPSMDYSQSAVDCSVLRPNGAYLSPREIDAISWHTFVFARAKPEDKIEIVKSFQRQGFVCAMTGDGVNDAPALRQANIGVAMGLAGSEVAKAASDMILTDDKFASIVDAIELGRTIYMNFRKFVMYLIGTNWSQVLVIMVAVLIGMPAPLEPLHILFINLITDGMPAIALSIEAPEGDVMRDRPRKKSERIVSGVIVSGILGHATALVLFMLFTFFMGLYWEVGSVLLDHMYDDDGELIGTCKRVNGEGTWDIYHDKDCVKEGLAIARTMVFLTISFSECLRPLTARSFSTGVFTDFFRNMPMLYAIVASFGATFLIVFVPGVDKIFHVKSPRWFEWLLVVTGVLATVISDELLKNKFRDERQIEHRWNKLFQRMGHVSMELRNLRSHFD
jgi:Ca2+-transporting ATPase